MWTPISNMSSFIISVLTVTTMESCTTRAASISTVYGVVAVDGMTLVWTNISMTVVYRSGRTSEVSTFLSSHSSLTASASRTHVGFVSTMHMFLERATVSFEIVAKVESSCFPYATAYIRESSVSCIVSLNSLNIGFTHG